jgi:hypothetical protein
MVLVLGEIISEIPNQIILAFHPQMTMGCKRCL